MDRKFLDEKYDQAIFLPQSHQPVDDPRPEPRLARSTTKKRVRNIIALSTLGALWYYFRQAEGVLSTTSSSVPDCRSSPEWLHGFMNNLEVPRGKEAEKLFL